jgi:hypothetical protein
VVVKKLILCVALLLVPALLFAGDKSKDKDKTGKDKKTAVDSGSFGIFAGGKRIGTEKFSIDQQGDEAVVTAEISVQDGDVKSEQNSELRIAADGSVKSYKWHSIQPSKEEFTVEPKDQLLIEHVITSEQKRQEIPFVLPISTVILDDNFFSHRELLIWRYLATGCAPQNGQLQCKPSHFGILIPHQQNSGTTSVELVGRDKINYKGSERELNKMKIDTAGAQWLIWVDDPENHYKVLKMTVPSTNIEIIRD